MFHIKRIGSGYRVVGPNYRSIALKGRRKALEHREMKVKEHLEQISQVEDTPTTEEIKSELKNVNNAFENFEDIDEPRNYVFDSEDTREIGPHKIDLQGTSEEGVGVSVKDKPPTKPKSKPKNKKSPKKKSKKKAK